jgi:hypothetical protein
MDMYFFSAPLYVSLHVCSIVLVLPIFYIKYALQRILITTTFV